MEKFVKAVADYGIALIVERWLELIVVVVVLVIWRWFTLHKVRSRIDALEKKANLTNRDSEFPWRRRAGGACRGGQFVSRHHRREGRSDIALGRSRPSPPQRRLAYQL